MGWARGRAATPDGGASNIQLVLPQGARRTGCARHQPRATLRPPGTRPYFRSTLKLVAARRRINISDSGWPVKVGLGAADAGSFVISAAIEAELPGVDKDTALALVERAHEVCPYSNATRGNLDVELTITEN